MTSYGKEYNQDYFYLKHCESQWSKPSYRLWWLLRSYLEIVKPLELTKGSKILSVGSGMGQLEQFLVQPWGLDVTSLDINIHALNTAKKLFNGNTQLVNASGSQIPFKPNTFNLILSFDLMEHLPQECLEQVFSEMERTVKPNGVMYHKITVSEEEAIDWDPTHHTKLSAQQWKEWFESHGWTTFKPVSHKIPIWSRKKIGLYPVEGNYYLKRMVYKSTRDGPQLTPAQIPE